MCRGEFVLVRHMHTFRAFQPTAIAGMATLARCHACCSITNPPCMTWFYAWSLISWQTDIYDYVRSKSFQAHTNSHYTEGWAPRISFWTFSSVLYLRPLTTSETKIFFVISTDKRNETRERADWPRFVVSTAHKKMYCCDAFTTWSSVHPMSCQPHDIACKEVKKTLIFLWPWLSVSRRGVTDCRFRIRGSTSWIRNEKISLERHACWVIPLTSLGRPNSDGDLRETFDKATQKQRFLWMVGFPVASGEHIRLIVAVGDLRFLL